MRFLLLGYGSIGNRHAQILRDMGHEVVTVDPDLSRGADFATVWKLHDPKAPDGGNFDGVIDCTPPDVRDGWSTRARNRFVEKPLGRVPLVVLQHFETIQYGWEMKPGELPAPTVRTMLGFCYHYAPRLAEFVDIIKQAKIYALFIVGGQALQRWHKADYRTRHYNGVVLDSLPHSFYIARWILGDLELVGSVVGKQSDLEIDVPDNAAVLLRSSDGVPCYCQADYLRDPRWFRIEAVTSNGVYYWEFSAKEADEMYRRQMQAWVSVCRGDLAQGYPNLEDGLAVQELLDEVAR